MLSTRDFKNRNKEEQPIVQEKGLKYFPFQSLRLGTRFTFIAILIVIFSLVACKDNSGIYRSKLSDCSDELSKNYKENVDKLKAYKEKDDTEGYDTAIEAKSILYQQFNAFLEIKPSKRFADKQDELKTAIVPALDSLDKLEKEINNFRDSGEIQGYKDAFEENFKTMNDTIEKINDIFASMAEAEDKK